MQGKPSQLTWKRNKEKKKKNKKDNKMKSCGRGGYENIIIKWQKLEKVNWGVLEKEEV